MLKKIGGIALLLATGAASSALADSSYVDANVRNVVVIPESMALLEVAPLGLPIQVCLRIDYDSELPDESKIGEDPPFCGVQTVTDDFDRFRYDDEGANIALTRANVIFQLLTSHEQEVRESFFEQNLKPILKTIHLKYQAKFMMIGSKPSIYLYRRSDPPNEALVIGKIGEIGDTNPDGSANVSKGLKDLLKLKLILPASYRKAPSLPTLNLPLAALVFDPKDANTSDVLKAFGDSVPH